MEIFINEISLHGQYNTIREFENAINELRAILSSLQKFEDRLIYSDVGRINTYSAVRDEYFEQSFNQIQDKRIKTAFNNIYYNKGNVKNWRNEQKINVEDDFLWIKNNENVKNSSIAEIAERKSKIDFKPYLLINFKTSRYAKNFSLDIKKICTDEIIKVHCCDSKETYQTWLNSNCKEFVYDFDNRFAPSDKQTILRDHTRFHKLLEHKRINGRILYQEKSTQNIWYVDSKHKGNQNPHIEVFNSTGKKYLGEADLNGNLTPPIKSKKNRKIKIK